MNPVKEIDILEPLKKKEEELEILLQEANVEASRIRDRAMLRREEIMASLPQELAVQRERYRKVGTERIEEEVRKVKEDAHRLVKEIKAEAQKKLNEGVRVILKAIIP
ncbi:MAG: hypothetical protein HY878_06670 [Deltaproteobacteria bacterium]|nr:hypothetical protein [Deltaproteobacteria bacterium]